jgi:hypothetical protein
VDGCETRRCYEGGVLGRKREDNRYAQSRRFGGCLIGFHARGANHGISTVGGVRFFLGGDKDREELEDESSDEEAVDIKQVKHQAGINKKTKKRAKAYEKALGKVKRQEKKKSAPQIMGNFSALHLLHDPQGFSSELFEKHLQKKTRMSFENRLLVLSLVTRLVGMVSSLQVGKRSGALFGTCGLTLR